MKSISDSQVEKDWRTLPTFRLLTAGVTVDPPGSTYGPRKQNHYEFIWIIEGEATAYFGRQIIRAEAGTILLRAPDVKDYYEWSPQRRTVHAYIHFDLDPKRRTKISKPGVPFSRAMPPNDVFRPLFSYFLGLNEKAGPLSGELMLSVLDLMIQSYIAGEVEMRVQPGAHLPEAVEQVVQMIRVCVTQTPPKSLLLKELAQVAHTTPENLCRLFKKNLDLGPLEYAKLAKLDRAANQLRRTSLTLKEIALATGFYDAYHLSRSFKQVYGVSPKEFKESVYNEWLSQKNPIIRTLYRPSTPLK